MEEFDIPRLKQSMCDVAETPARKATSALRARGSRAGSAWLAHATAAVGRAAAGRDGLGVVGLQLAERGHVEGVQRVGLALQAEEAHGGRGVKGGV